jgi:parallel beta-helix repeat protein
MSGNNHKKPFPVLFKREAIGVLAVFAFILALAACLNPYNGESTLTLYVGREARSAAYPPDDATLARLVFVINISGPGESQTITFQGQGLYSITLIPGLWQVTAKAYLSGDLYAEGAAAAEVRAGVENRCVIPMSRGPAGFTVAGITVSPAASAVTRGLTQQFTATVAGDNSPSQNVTWSVSGQLNGGTSIDNGLLIVAPAESAAVLTVTAASTAVPSKSGTATVTVVTGAPPLPAGVYAVKAGGSGTGDGSSWGNASGDLQAVINAASAGEEIWVTEGTYKPNRQAQALGTETPDNRHNAFVLKEGVKIYGGFTGNESARTARNWKNNVTILSGDIGTPGVASDNSHHVVIIAGDSANQITNAAVLDGFTISGGYGNTNVNITVTGQLINTNYGGGIHITGYAKPILENLIIRDNETTTGGGGIYTKSIDADPDIRNCIISNNTANPGNGGGLYAEASSGGTLTNVLISGNDAYNGGGVYTSVSLRLNNVTIVENSITASGTNAYSGFLNASATPQVFNCLIWGNTGGSGNSGGQYGSIVYSSTLVQGLPAGGGLLDGNSPTDASLFVDYASGDYHLKTGSEAINAGNNSNFPSIPSVDLDGNTRIVNTTIDLGAYEYQ